MARRSAPALTFEQRQRAETLWIVCPEVFIPVATEALAERVMASFHCPYDHRLVRFNLRPINYDDLWGWWRQHAWQHPFQETGEGVAGGVTRTEVAEWAI
ncbi:MAG TPA: hypothetical protein VK088_08825, partial [Acidimicrobiia bacterium]|nr:hypothetical protein [Acidimicrobiia bacterium]